MKKKRYIKPVLVEYGRIGDLTRGWGGHQMDSLLGLIAVNDDCSTSYQPWLVCSS
jgi:hypothetical protein